MDTERPGPEDAPDEDVPCAVRRGPNAILRGGPFDGEQVRVTASVPVVRVKGLVRHVYEPTGRLDDEFPALTVYAHEHTLVY